MGKSLKQKLATGFLITTAGLTGLLPIACNGPRGCGCNKQQKQLEKSVNFFYKENLTIDFIDTINYNAKPEEVKLLKDQLKQSYGESILTKRDLRDVLGYIDARLSD